MVDVKTKENDSNAKYLLLTDEHGEIFPRFFDLVGVCVSWRWLDFRISSIFVVSADRLFNLYIYMEKDSQSM